jgi:hypothetical protein
LPEKEPIANARNKTRVPNDQLHPGSGYAPDRLVKPGFPAKLYFEFFHFPSRFNRRRLAASVPLRSWLTSGET